MTTAALVNMVVDQGADWAAQIYWTSGNNVPYSVAAPMRMDIKDDHGGVALTLQTNENSANLEDPFTTSGILYNSDSGLIQLTISAEDSDRLGQGFYDYDLYVSYSDKVTASVRLKRLMAGKVIVSERITRNI